MGEMKQEQKQALSASFGGSDVILANIIDISKAILVYPEDTYKLPLSFINKEGKELHNTVNEMFANMTKTQEIKKAQLRVVANFVLKANKIAGTLPN
jgi:hypothetical protein